MRKGLLAVAALLVAAAVWGQEQKKDSVRTYDISNVVVTATRTPLPLKEAPVLTRVISSTEIARSGVASLPALLERELAGVEFHQAGFGSAVSFQGLDARYVVFLVDGERMAGETNGNIDYGRLPLDNIERIEIVKGASSVLYGSNAMGAVVNIITRMPAKQFEIGASVRYGTPYQDNDGETLNRKDTPQALSKYRNALDMPNLRANLSAGLRIGKVRSLTSATWRTTDAYRLTSSEDEERHYPTLYQMTPQMQPGMPPKPVMTDKGIPVFIVKSTVADTTITAAPDARGMSVSGWKELNVSERIDVTLSEKFRVEADGNFYMKKRYDFLNSISDSSPLADTVGLWGFESYRGYTLRGVLEHTPNDRNKVWLSVLRDDYFRYQDSVSGPSTPKQRHTITTPRLLWTWELNAWNRLTSGLEYTNERLRYDLAPGGYDTPKERSSTSLYVQDELFAGRRMSFVAGVRGDYSPDFGGRATPKLSAKYDFGEFSMRANYAMGYRTPSLKEMYMEFEIPGGNNIIRGNAGLRPETNNYFSLCAEYTSPRVNLSATGYYYDFRNKIDVVGFDEGGKTILRYENIGHSTLRGAEVVARARVAKGLYVRANYSYTDQREDASSESTQYIYPSPHTATAGVDYGFDLFRCYVLLTGSVRYVGPKEYVDMLGYIEGTSMRDMKYFTGSYSGRHAGYAVCGLGLDVKWPWGLDVNLGVDNLNNYRPPVVNFNSAICPGRNYYISVAFKL